MDGREKEECPNPNPETGQAVFFKRKSNMLDSEHNRNDNLWTDEQVQAYLKISRRTLYRYRRKKRNALPYVELSPKKIRYQASEVVNWVKSRRVNH